MATKKWIYLFSEGNKDMRDLLGGKGAGVAEMTNAGLPVPPGFTITTEACNAYYDAGKQFPAGMWEQTLAALKKVEEQTGKKFGDPNNPLLVSVRSGAKFSMPGMMDTVLNLGLNAQTLAGLARLTGDERFAYDAYRRLIQMFGRIVMGIDGEKFEAIFDAYKERTTGKKDTDLTTDMLKAIVAEYKALYKAEIGSDFPEDPYEQLRLAIGAVFGSWFGKRAVDYRDFNKIPHDLGTAANVQTMVFGNMGFDSGTGVAFTRDPATGEDELYGEYLLNAQGEDVVAGIRTPKPISQLREEMPGIYKQLEVVKHKLEQHYRDVQDLEFVLEHGTLWLLATRTAKRTANASLRFAVDFLDENLISEREAIFRVQPVHLGLIFAPKLPPGLDKRPIARGLAASPGATSGMAVFDADTAEVLADAGNKVIFIRPELESDDIHGLLRAQGLLTSRGGITSHGAVASHGLGIPCIAGATIKINAELKFFHASGKAVREGDIITIDGTSGAVYLGEIPLVGVNLEDDPYLMRYASLVWAVNPDDYVEDGVGTLWLLRDMIRDKSAPRAFGLIPSSSRPLTELPRSMVDGVKYVSFIQPPEALIRDILNMMHWHDDSDTAMVAWGIMDNLVRLLQNEVGISNHHLAVRPLTDPEHSLIDLRIQPVVSSSESPVQLIGLEFFGINRFLRNYLPWACVQWWVVVRLSSSEPGLYWRLDRINPQGESLIPGERKLVGLLVILNGKCLTTMETRRFYNELRKRELGWDWYKENNTSWREVVGTLQSVQTGQPTDRTMLTKCQVMGLLTKDLQLSSVGSSLLFEQTTANRRHISFAGRELRDE
jgi:phosphohistidine swiveling domain-containing protein